MDATFDDNEKMLRAVYPSCRRPNFWVNGRLSSAALKDARGLSVDRTYKREISVAVEYARSHLQGFIVSISVPICREVNALLLYKPSPNNIYHSEIHGSVDSIVLSDKQAKVLARSAVLEYDPNSSHGRCFEVSY